MKKEFIIALIILILLVIAFGMLGLYKINAKATAVTSASCTDSDGGLKPFIAGVVKGNYVNGTTFAYEDKCSSDNTKVNEWACAGDLGNTPKEDAIICKYKCKTGACLTEISSFYDISVEGVAYKIYPSNNNTLFINYTVTVKNIGNVATPSTGYYSPAAVQIKPTDSIYSAYGSFSSLQAGESKVMSPIKTSCNSGTVFNVIVFADVSDAIKNEKIEGNATNTNNKKTIEVTCTPN